MNTRKDIILQYSIGIGLISLIYSTVLPLLQWEVALMDSNKFVGESSLSAFLAYNFEALMDCFSNMGFGFIRGILIGIPLGVLTFKILDKLPIKYKEIKDRMENNDK